MLPTLRPDNAVSSTTGYVYHATNRERAHEIAFAGKLVTHGPSWGTDQDTWPDGATGKRSYWTRNASLAWQFAPEYGEAVLLRTPETVQFKQESTTRDIYTRTLVRAAVIEILLADGRWMPLATWVADSLGLIAAAS